MDLNKLTIKSQQALQQAQHISIERGQQIVEQAHMLKGMMEVDEHVLPFLLQKLNINPTNVEQTVDKMIDSFPKVSGGQINMSRSANEALSRAFIELKTLGD